MNVSRLTLQTNKAIISFTYYSAENISIFMDLSETIIIFLFEEENDKRILQSNQTVDGYCLE